VFGDLMLLGFLSGNGSGFGGQNIAQLCSVLIISPPATGLQDCHCRRVP
jgi:hypothetical protein